MVFSGKSTKKRRTNSSTKDDFPAPPVPVIPKTGVVLFSFFLCISSKVSLATSGKFSAAEITRAIALGDLFGNSFNSPFNVLPIGKSEVFTKSLIIACRPSSRPSSGE